jgi:membrane protein implicated in regulation of membrane protease activity
MGRLANADGDACVMAQLISVLALLHFPLDIAGSALIALAIVFAAWTVLRRWQVICG